MRRPQGNRRRASVLLAAALGLIAMLALPSFASARGGDNHRSASAHHQKRHHHRRHHRRHRHLSSADGTAATIASFDPDTGKLVIALDGGDTVSGLVTDRTHIRCGGGCDKTPDDSSDDQGAGASNAGPRPNPPGHDGTPPGSSEDPGQGAAHTAKCTTADLVEGAVVKQAELVIVSGKAYFKLVALGK